MVLPESFIFSRMNLSSFEIIPLKINLMDYDADQRHRTFRLNWVVKLSAMLITEFEFRK